MEDKKQTPITYEQVGTFIVVVTIVFFTISGLWFWIAPKPIIEPVYTPLYALTCSSRYISIDLTTPEHKFIDEYYCSDGKFYIEDTATSSSPYSK